jgi:hypothetical protein
MHYFPRIYKIEADVSMSEGRCRSVAEPLVAEALPGGGSEEANKGEEEHEEDDYEGVLVDLALRRRWPARF